MTGPRRPPPRPADADTIATIDRARHAAKLSHHRQLADLAGLGRRTVDRILDDGRPPTLEQMRRLCAALRIDVPASYSWIRG